MTELTHSLTFSPAELIALSLIIFVVLAVIIPLGMIVIDAARAIFAAITEAVE